MTISFRKAWFIALTLVICGIAAGGVAAFPYGITGFSGNPDINGGANCNSCHSGGITPTVTLTGPLTATPGSTNSYTLVISGGQEIAGGLNVSATGGTLAAGGSDTQIIAGELTHTAPKFVNASNEVVFTFDWTAPNDPGAVTLYAAGNSVNDGNAWMGDRANTTTLAVTVGDPSAVQLRTGASATASGMVANTILLLVLIGAAGTLVFWRRSVRSR